MNIYLDIDGVLYHKGRLANHIDLFIKHVTENHKCFWLTTRIRHGEGVENVLRLFPSDLQSYLKKIEVVPWEYLKPEAIDYSKEFAWLDDNAYEKELELLRQHDALDGYIHIELNEDPDQLKKLVETVL